MAAITYMRLEGNLWESVLFYHVVPKGLRLSVRLGSTKSLSASCMHGQPSVLLSETGFQSTSLIWLGWLASTGVKAVSRHVWLLCECYRSRSWDLGPMLQ